MNDVFLDTVVMIAVWDDTDQWHADAKAAYTLLFSNVGNWSRRPLYFMNAETLLHAVRIVRMFAN